MRFSFSFSFFKTAIIFPNFSPPTRQKQIAEEKEQLRKVREAERLAKMEAKRLEKEALAKERAEAQAREQARREIEREKARLAKRYPLPDEVRCAVCGIFRIFFLQDKRFVPLGQHIINQNRQLTF